MYITILNQSYIHIVLKSIMDMHGGNILVKSYSNNAGTTIKIILPAVVSYMSNDLSSSNKKD